LTFNFQVAPQKLHITGSTETSSDTMVLLQVVLALAQALLLAQVCSAANLFALLIDFAKYWVGP